MQYHPSTTRPVFLQLDDLDQATVQRIQPLFFLTLRTSPGNHQAWIALTEPLDKDFTRRFVTGIGADDTASDAARVAGSQNFKEKHAPNYPVIQILHSTDCRIVSRTELEAMQIAVSPILEQHPSVASARRSLPNKQWPSYELCLQGAPLNHAQTGPDVSPAAFTWCMIAIDWGWTVDETAFRLIYMSLKDKYNRMRYALLTSQRAAVAVERR